MIDAHAHLSFPDYQSDLDLIIARAKEAGVKKIICASSNLEESQRAVEIAQKYPGVVFAGIGIHPQQTDPENKMPLDKQIKALESLASQKEVACLAECGLDYAPAPPPEKDRSKKNQYYLFEAQLKIAQKLNLPVQIHSRQAYLDTLAILKSYPKIRGLWHCYSEGKKGIEAIINLGLYFGVDGNLTYDPGLQNVFKLIPLNKIILETDSPLLTPLPFRGQRNEPAYLFYLAKTLAKMKPLRSKLRSFFFCSLCEDYSFHPRSKLRGFPARKIKNVPLAKIDQITSRNTKNLFTKLAQ
ncbi:MAG: TatD family hydrolase [Candidatus Shapirobacteria bacterium]